MIVNACNTELRRAKSPTNSEQYIIHNDASQQLSMLRTVGNLREEVCKIYITTLKIVRHYFFYNAIHTMMDIVVDARS